MDLQTFDRVNRERCESPNGFGHSLKDWSLSDWFTATLGELGEAANIAKKLNRVRDGITGNKETEADLRDKLARELADTFIYLSLLAQSVGVNLSEVVPQVFNAKSEQIGSPIRIPAKAGRRRVYIAGPISKGDLAHNVNQATAAFVALAKAGFAPMCPHWSVYCKPAQRASVRDRVLLHHDREGVFCEATAMGATDMTHADWMGIDLPWVEVSDAVLRLPGESVGAEMEVACAQERGIPVFLSVDDLVLAMNGFLHSVTA